MVDERLVLRVGFFFCTTKPEDEVWYGLVGTEKCIGYRYRKRRHSEWLGNVVHARHALPRVTAR